MSSPPPSRSPSPPLQLDPGTLALLNDFLQEKAAEDEQFRKLSEQRAKEEEEAAGQPMMSVDEFRVRPGPRYAARQLRAPTWPLTPLAPSRPLAQPEWRPPNPAEGLWRELWHVAVLVRPLAVPLGRSP